MSRTIEQISLTEYLRRNPEMSESGGTSGSSSDAALQGFLNSIANNSIASQAYGIPMNTNSRGPVNASGLLTMSDAQANAITQQRIADRGLGSLDSELPPPGNDQRPSDNPGGEDSPFDIIMRSIVGQIGNPQDVSPEMIAVLNGRLDGSSLSELEEVGRQIVEAGGFEEWLASQQEEEVDLNQSTIDDDTTEDDESLVNQVTDAVGDGVDSVINSVQDAVDAAIDALPDGASLEDIMDWIEDNVRANVQTITPQSIAEEYIGRGVGVNLPTGFPGAGTVFVPGVIPGLPPSSTIIGTVDQILNAPGQILDQALERIEGVVEDPLGTLEAVLRGAADEEGNITAGVLSQVIDDIISGSSRTTSPTTNEPSTDEPGTQLGGAGNDTPDDAVQFDSNNEPIQNFGGAGSDTTDDIVGGAAGALLGAAAGGAGGMLANKFKYVPKVKRVDFVDPGMPQVIGGQRQRSSIMGLFEEYL